MTSQREVLELTEYAARRFARSELPEGAGEALWRSYRNQIAVEFPSPKTDGLWQLTAHGWVGYIPLSSDLHLWLQPRIDIGNISRMLEYAYRLRSFHFLEGLLDCQSLREFYERLAVYLARLVLDRGRKGFYREYVPLRERLPYVRGRIDVRQMIQAPWNVKLQCQFEEHTANVEDNQILAWTLHGIARSGMCGDKSLLAIRRAFRALDGLVALESHTAQACVGRLYNRLNEDYRPLHALCRFFLEHSGPRHEKGDRHMIPFLVNMARLFELFVAEWLVSHLPPEVRLKSKERVNIDAGGNVYFDIDLVLYGAETGEVQFVLDTKYKPSSSPAPNDVAQVVAYAEAKGCGDAVLVYPRPLPRPLDEKVGSVRVRSLTFDLDSDIEDAGNTFVRQLLPSVRAN